MISSTSAYQDAVVADTRRIYLKVIVDISDPDLVFGAITYSGIASDVCVPGQVEDKVFQLVPYGTLETDRWILDGTMQIFPEVRLMLHKIIESDRPRPSPSRASCPISKIFVTSPVKPSGFPSDQITLSGSISDKFAFGFPSSC